MLLGDEAVESLKDHLAGGQAEAFPFPARTSGATGAVHVYIDSNDSARTLIVGLYANLNGHPGSLLTTGSLSAPQTGAWDTATVAPTQLVSGTTYWLAVLGTGGALRYRDRWHGPCNAQTSRQTNLGALAAQWSTGTLYSTCPISAYVTPATSTLPEGPPLEVQPVESPPPPPPPPPAAPANSSPPAISGTATEGQPLTATTGAWTGSPTSYAYQWQDCDTAGANCANVSGAQAAGYTLQASDVGHTMRMVVTATNSGGSTPASSAATAAVVADPPPPPPPTASFSYTPTSPVAGQPVTLEGTSSTCPDGPCTYNWSDDGSTTRPTPPLWPLGSGQTLLYTFSGAGTKYVRLVVTDATGQTATVEHNVVVEASSTPPPPPTPPSNTGLPTVTGTAQVGQTLTASNGTWSGSTPMGFGYQWQDCNTSGESCSNVSGATSATYTAVEGDVGQTLRAVVTASNAGGAAPAASAATAIVAAKTAPPTPPTNVTVPSVSGTAQVGQTLTTSNGTWNGSTPMSFGYQWQDCDSAGEACSNVAGATSASYMLAAGDVGHTVRVIVTASNANGSTPASSPATAAVGSASGGGGPGTCTTTVSNLASVVSLSSSEPDGSTICIADGSYGTLAMTAARAGYVTIAAANGPGHVTVSGLTVSSGASHLKLDGLNCTCNTQLGLPVNGGTGPNNIQITRTDSQGFQVEAGSHDLLFDHDFSHDGPYGFLLNGSRYPVAGGCCQTANYPLIENVTISNSKIGPLAASGADAFQVKGFNNLTISNNDINDIYQNGNHNDGVQTVHGGANLTITHNYFHDGNVELFMIKDGDITGNNAITNNLVVRENSSLNPACGGCSTAVVGQWYSPQNATIANNTIIEPGLYLRSQLNLVGNGNPFYLVPSNIDVNHNVIQQFRAEDDETAEKSLGLFEPVLTHSYNLFGPYTKNYLTAGTGDTFVSTISNTSSIFVNPSGNDFRLSSNPNNIGVNWKPSEYHYGP